MSQSLTQPVNSIDLSTYKALAFVIHFTANEKNGIQTW